jgi:hypothetical protein
VIAEILVEDSRGVYRGQVNNNNNNICHLADAFIQSDLQSCVHTFYVWVGQNDIYEGARVYGFGVGPGRFIDTFV